MTKFPGLYCGCHLILIISKLVITFPFSNLQHKEKDPCVTLLTGIPMFEIFVIMVCNFLLDMGSVSCLLDCFQHSKFQFFSQLEEEKQPWEGWITKTISQISFGICLKICFEAESLLEAMFPGHILSYLCTFKIFFQVFLCIWRIFEGHILTSMSDYVPDTGTSMKSQSNNDCRISDCLVMFYVTVVVIQRHFLQCS